MDKIFEATFGDGYSRQGTERVTIEFFYPDNGYSQADMDAIESLKTGESYRVACPEEQTVKRVQ